MDTIFVTTLRHPKDKRNQTEILLFKSMLTRVLVSSQLFDLNKKDNQGWWYERLLLMGLRVLTGSGLVIVREVARQEAGEGEDAEWGREGLMMKSCPSSLWVAFQEIRHLLPRHLIWPWRLPSYFQVMIKHVLSSHSAQHKASEASPLVGQLLLPDPFLSFNPKFRIIQK